MTLAEKAVVGAIALGFIVLGAAVPTMKAVQLQREVDALKGRPAVVVVTATPFPTASPSATLIPTVSFKQRAAGFEPSPTLRLPGAVR